MTEYGRFFDATSYGEADQAEVQSRMVRDGVISGVDSELVATSGGAGFVNIGTGEAWVQGFWYKNDATKTLAITSNVTAVTRIDRLVLRLNRTGNTLLAAIHEGVLGAGLPTLTQVAGGTWELPIAQISTTSGVSTITDDRQRSTNLYNPMTTADDIIVATASGVPIRKAKGGNNTVFGVDASGVLGYRQVTSADIQDGSIVGTDLAAGTLGSTQMAVGGTHGNRIQAGTLTGNEIQDRTIGEVDLALDSVTNNQIAANTIHPGRLTSWSGGTYANHVLYDYGGGISVAKVQDILCAVNSIHGNKLMSATVTGTQIANGTINAAHMNGRAITGFGFQLWSNGSTWGSGAWVYPGGVNLLSGVAGGSVVFGVFSITLYSNTVSAVLYAGIGVDAVSPSWYTQTNQMASSPSYINGICMTFMHTMTASAHNYYPCILTNAGSLNQYGTAYFAAAVLHR